jgi:AcrR family transcriptional regulator
MGLREHKKQQTVEALRAAALRLALDRGPENVRVDDIAAAAGVSPRTYNNYFSSREQAIVSAVVAERESRVAAAILARPAQVRLSDAVIDAVVEQYADPDALPADVLLMITTSHALQSTYAEAVAMAGDVLTEAIIERTDGMNRLVAQVLAASVGAAAKLALTDWLGGTPPANGFVVPSGSLADRMRAALLPLAPALDAAVRDRLEG